MPFSTRNSVIAHLHGCVIVASLIKKINRLHERCLRIIYCDKQSSFEELLKKDSYSREEHSYISYRNV